MDLDLTGAANLGAAFAATADRCADLPALRHGTRTITYAQLAGDVHAAATVLTRRLRAGERRNDPPVVAVLLDPSPALIVTVLATVTAGAAYLPIDVQVPDAYLHTVLAEARPRLVVTTAAYAARIPGDTMVVLSEELLAAAPAAAATPGRPVDRDDPAYVIYTSGSTGTPKGVLVSHAAMLNSTAARMDAYGVAQRMPLLHSVAFDLSSGVLFWALLGGGTLILTSAPLHDIAATLRLIRDEQVTHLVYPASLYAPFLDRAAAGPPTGLHTVMIGSERWSPVIIDRHAALLPDTSLFNEYGPTETCVWTSAGHVYDAATGTAAAMNIGRPIRNTCYRILDPGRRPVPAGQPGELWISGANVGLGYLHRAKLTAQKFRTRPDGTREYRTGDLVTVDDRGNFVFVGRIDRQFKVGGNRIEAGHVEAVLMTHPSIEQAYVTVAGTGLHDAILAAYLVQRADAPPADTAELAAHTAAALPGYMVPSVWLWLDALPRTGSGKIDEARLPPPAGHGRSSRTAPSTAKDRTGTPVEQALAATAAAILGVATVGMDTPLTDLGANSLAFVRLAAAIHRDYGVDVPISALFTQPTVASAARAVAQATPSDRPALRSTSHPDTGVALSGQQRQIWVLQHLAPHALAYHTQFSLRLTGPLDVAVLREALRRVVVRHEILRTTFHDHPTGAVQVVHPPWPVDIDIVDLSTVPAARRQAALAAAIRDQVATGFDPGVLPLLRWHLYRLGDGDWNLLQVEHHFVHDGWSAALILAELRDTYAALAHGADPPGPLPGQYRDYADWYHRWQTSTDHAAQLAYWRRTLEGCPSDPVTFYPDRPRPAVQRFTGGCLTADIPAATLARIDQRCAAHRVSRFAALLSAFTLLVWRHTAEADLVVGSALANRRHHATGELLGMFVNALPLRLSVDPTAEFAALATATMRTLLDAQDHQELPLLDLLDGLEVPRDPARNPLFQLMFAFHDSPRPAFDITGPHGDLHGELVIEHNGSAKSDVNIVCVPHPPRPGTGLRHDGMQVRWEYDSDLYDQGTARRLLDGFIHVVDQITKPWQQRVDEMDLLGPAQTARILQAGTGPAVAAPYPTLHTGVDTAIERHPDRIAIVHGPTRWTYADLEAHTRALQHALTATGVSQGTVVAVTCPPSPALVAACLAVLRCGAAYLCLDTTQPPARLRQLLTDATPAAVIGTADTLANLPDTGAPTLDTDTITPTGLPAPARPAENGDRPAYLVYTSGSTGTPKAVIATQTNAVTAVHARTVVCGPQPPRTLITLPAIFDVAGSMTFWTLWLGGTLILPTTDDDVRDPDTVRALIDAQAVSHVNFVASFHRALLASTRPDDTDAGGGWARSLRVVAIGGEPCTPELVRAHADVLGGVELLNEYGPTEATVWCTASRVYTPARSGVRTPAGPARPAVDRRVTVGTPLPNTAVFVLQPHDRLAPIGATGELVVGGAGVAAGYLRRDELARDRFVTATIGPLAGWRLYRTGDRGRLTGDGDIEVLGRIDDQVKIRGYRVELGEIEACLRSHPGVSDVAVTVDKGTAADLLVAYLVPVGDPAALPAASVRGWAAQHLPGYMVPARLVVLAALPRTSTGKLDRSRLPRADQHTSRPASTTPTQARLVDLWQELLGGEEVGLDDDFFALGGDSLQAIRLAAATRAAGLPLSVTQLLAHRTVREQAAICDRDTTDDSRWDATTADKPRGPRPRRPGGTRLTLSPIQAWFFAQQFADPDHFNQARIFAVDPRVPATTVTAAVAWTIGRHDAFRTRFVHEYDGWHPVLDDRAEAPLDQVALGGGAHGRTETQLRRQMNTLHRSLRLNGGPLFRFVLFTDPDTSRRWLGVVAHHLLVDAVSWEVLRRDLDTACRHITTNPAALPEGPAPGQPTHCTPAPALALDTEAGLWWRRLAAAPTPVLTRRAGQPATAAQLQRRTVRLSVHATRYLTTDAPRLTGNTTRSLLLAAWASALAPLSDRPGLYVYVEGHGRNWLADADQIVGWYTTVNPVLLDTAGYGPLAATAADIERQLTAVPDDDSYLRARYLNPDSPLGTLLCQMRAPEVTFNYLGTTASSASGQLLHTTRLPTGQPIGARNVLPTALDITAAVSTDTMTVTCAYQPDHFPAAAVEAAVDRFLAAVEAAARTVALTAGPFQPGARPHFLIHPVGGSVSAYGRLARHLAPGQVCYGLADDGTAESVAGLAAAYRDRIRAVQPHGPYTITGWSFGAAVAFEIARQLDADGLPHRITLIDPPDPAGPTDDPAVLAAHLGAVLPERPAPQLLDAASRTAGLAPAARSDRLAGLLGLGQLPDGERGATAHRVEQLVRHHAALTGWVATGTVRALRVVQSAATRTAGADPAAWQAHCRTPLADAVIAGTHTSILLGDGLADLAPLLTPTDGFADSAAEFGEQE